MLYLWLKAFHIISIVCWFAGLFYLPRLFVYHAQSEDAVSKERFSLMERKLYRGIMNPSMIATWTFGLALVFTPSVVDWAFVWPWVKAACVLVMSWFHHWLARRRKDFATGQNTRSGYTYRMMNEVPTVLMLVIVVMVIVKPF